MPISQGLPVVHPLPEREWYSLKEAASLGFGGYSTHLKSISQGKLRAHKIGGERGVTLAVTNRDGWSFKMRRTDNGRRGRKKASALSPDFTAAAVTEKFRQRAASITPVPQQPAPGVVLEAEEFDQIAMRLKRRMASKKPRTPARERFVRGRQRQHSREYGD